MTTPNSYEWTKEEHVHDLQLSVGRLWHDMRRHTDNEHVTTAYTRLRDAMDRFIDALYDAER